MRLRIVLGTALLAILSACSFFGAAVIYWTSITSLSSPQYAGTVDLWLVSELAIGILSTIPAWLLFRIGSKEAKAEGTTFMVSLFTHRWLILAIAVLILVSVIIVILLISQ